MKLKDFNIQGTSIKDSKCFKSKYFYQTIVKNLNICYNNNKSDIELINEAKELIKDFNIKESNTCRSCIVNVSCDSYNTMDWGSKPKILNQISNINELKPTCVDQFIVYYGNKIKSSYNKPGMLIQHMANFITCLMWGNKNISLLMNSNYQTYITPSINCFKKCFDNYVEPIINKNKVVVKTKDKKFKLEVNKRVELKTKNGETLFGTIIQGYADTFELKYINPIYNSISEKKLRWYNRTQRWAISGGTYITKLI